MPERTNITNGGYKFDEADIKRNHFKHIFMICAFKIVLPLLIVSLAEG